MQGPLGSNIAVSAIGTRVPVRAGAQNDAWVSQLHGAKYSLAVNGNLFRGANASGATISAALATTYTGLCLNNPAGNTKNLVVRRVAGSIIVAPAATFAMGLIVGYAAGGVTVHTTPVTTLGNALLNGAAPTAKLDAACTLVGTPVWANWFANNAVSAGLPGFSLDMEGGIVIPPGGYAAIGGNVVGPTVGLLGAFEWEEVPVLA